MLIYSDPHWPSSDVLVLIMYVGYRLLQYVSYVQLETISTWYHLISVISYFCEMGGQAPYKQQM